jgi:hypothetical protein
LKSFKFDGERWQLFGPIIPFLALFGLDVGVR